MPSHHGLILIVTGDESEFKAPVRSINVKAKTCGPIAQNTIKFYYKNTNDTAISSRFVFPVNSLSSIYSLTADVGGRKIVGKVKEKEEAQKEYKEAVNIGKNAVLAKESKEAGDIIELELGAFGKDEEAVIEIKEVFEMKLIKKATNFQYKFPTSMFVRYGGGVTQEVTRAGVTDYFLNFEIDCMAVKSIKPKSWLGQEVEGFTFQFNNNRKVFEKDHDVVLDLALAEDFKGFKILEHWRDLSVITEQETDQKLLLTSFLVNVESVPISELPAKEYVFVIDCSGSMHGQRMEDTKKTLQSLINSLPIGSKFNIVRFGSNYEKLFKTPNDYNKENKKIAIQLAETTSADLGGTEMYECLKSVLEDKRTITEFKRQVFVLTDGGISNQDATLKLVADNSKENRIFSFGIGSGCSTSLVNGLADQGMGTASFIADKGGFSWDKEKNLSEICIKSVMASASQHISKIEVMPTNTLLAPKSDIAMVVDSTCLNIFHSDNMVEAKLCITKATTMEAFTTETTAVDTQILSSPFEANVLHKLAAKKMISQLVTEIKAAGHYCVEDKKKTVVDLSIKEQVLSPYTALVGIADEATVVGVTHRVDVGRAAPAPTRCVGRSMRKSATTSRSATTSAYPRRARSSIPLSLSSADLLNERASVFKKKSTNLRKQRRNYRGGITRLKSKITKTFNPSSVVVDDGAGDNNNIWRRCESDLEDLEQDNTTESDLEDLEQDNISGIISIKRELKSTLPKKSLPNNHQTVTNAQDPRGFWNEVASFDFDSELLAKIKEHHSEIEIVGTIYALILLLSRFSDKYDEWKLSAIKGCDFLKKKMGPNAVENIKAVDNPLIIEDIVDELFE